MIENEEKKKAKTSNLIPQTWTFPPASCLLPPAFLLAQSNPQDQGVTNADQIVQGALNGSRMVVASFDKDWQDFASGNSDIYTAVVKVCLLGAAIIVGFWSIGWYKEIAEHGFDINVINEMIYPIIVIFMLGINNGALLADTSLMFRGVSNSLNDKVLDITRNGVTLREAIRDTNMNQAFALAAKAKVEQCQQQPDTVVDENGKQIHPRKLCIDNATQDAKQKADDYRSKNQLPALPNSWNPLDVAGEAFNSVVQGLLYFIFSGLEAGFQYLIQVSFLINAYIGPIFLVLSMLPLGAKPIYAWMSGWLGLGLILISYSIIVGIAASSIVNTPDTNPLFLQLIEGILSPVLAIAIGMYGGTAIFSGFTSAAKLLIK